jgi:hypothetical protein
MQGDTRYSTSFVRYLLILLVTSNMYMQCSDLLLNPSQKHDVLNTVF